MSSTNTPRFYFGLPRDKSFQAYRDWIMEMVRQLGGSEDNLSEQQWVKRWEQFWTDDGARS